MIRRMEESLIKNDEIPTGYFGIPWDRVGFCFKKEMLEDLDTHEFEGHSFCVPREYDHILRSYYGDYMVPPPEKDRINPHKLECYIDE